MGAKLEQLKMNICFEFVFCWMHNPTNLHNLEILFENVQIAKNVCESIHNLKVMFEKVQIGKKIYN